MNKWIIGLLLMLFTMQVDAAIETYQFDQSEHEALYKQMIDELRCLVCQNQNLSASNSGLARDLRKQTYDMVREGKSYDQIVAYMTQRYGDFVLYKPPVKASTFLLWFGPILLLVLGILILISTLKKRKNDIAEPLTLEQQKQITEILNKGEG